MFEIEREGEGLREKRRKKHKMQCHVTRKATQISFVVLHRNHVHTQVRTRSVAGSKITPKKMAR